MIDWIGGSVAAAGTVPRNYLECVPGSEVMIDWTKVKLALLRRSGLCSENTASVTVESPQVKIDLPYVFVIGFNKTATTTIHHFFERNGFPSIHWDHGRLAKTMLDNCLNDRLILTGYDDQYRVFSDMIVQTSRLRFEANSLFRILDSDYPGSYFIYNNRKLEDWLTSRCEQPIGRYKCTNVELEMRLLNTQDPQRVVERWRKERTDFEREVREYFVGHDRFLEIEISNPEAPGRIADLLGMDLDRSCWGHHKTNHRRPWQ